MNINITYIYKSIELYDYLLYSKYLFSSHTKYSIFSWIFLN